MPITKTVSWLALPELKDLVAKPLGGFDDYAELASVVRKPSVSSRISSDPSTTQLVWGTTGIGKTTSVLSSTVAHLSAGQISHVLRGFSESWVEYARPESETPPVLFIDGFDRWAFAFSRLLNVGGYPIASRPRAWLERWRSAALDAVLAGATPEELREALRRRRAELRARRPRRRSAPWKRLATQLGRLAHFVIPNAPPARLEANAFR